jgi:hypothetical protein
MRRRTEYKEEAKLNELLKIGKMTEKARERERKYR